MTKWAFSFGDGNAQGGASMTDELGIKGAHLAEMTTLGLPVPPGFTLTTGLCRHYFGHDRTLPENLKVQIRAAGSQIEEIVGAKLGTTEFPLVLSVRASTRVPMKGIIDGVLNLGLSDKAVEGLANISKDPRFAWDCYARFIQSYADVVMGVDHYHFEDIVEEYKEDAGLHLDNDLSAEDWKKLCAEFKGLIEKEAGEAFPQDTSTQLYGVITAMLDRWMSPSAKVYREINSIPDDWGLAITVQGMVFGNLGEESVTGVVWSRNPENGERNGYGEYLRAAQGHDLTNGIRKPLAITKRRRLSRGEDTSLEEDFPDIFKELNRICEKLEWHYRAMQRIEFTVQRGKLWLLQTHAGSCSAKASLKIAVDYVSEGIIDERRALMRVNPSDLDQMLHSTLDPTADKDIFTEGIAAAPGAVSGAIAFDAATAENWSKAGRDVILCTLETSPEDIHGMHAAKGVLTARGGITSHAAVVARGMGCPCVTGASRLDIDIEARQVSCGDVTLREGACITIDGSTGEVMIGTVKTMQADIEGDFATLLKWADRYRRMNVRTNAETPTEIQTALEFGAEGIGLCRTEHMFFDADRIIAMREMILADGPADRRHAIQQLRPMQISDFEAIFRLMDGKPVTIRLFDPPLHEFMPQHDVEFEQVADAVEHDVESLRRRAVELHEFNPMLGHRGCRVGITYPEIYEMQAQAIFEAAITVEKELGHKVQPEIMIPLIATQSEFEAVRHAIDTLAQRIFSEQDHTIDYQVGTMIELPRACLRAGDIAAAADFFSYGTNDLTQTSMGISRDDAARFIDQYVKQDVFKFDPFVTLDRGGVGELIEIGCERGRAANSEISLGVCGEHGGDPTSIDFFHRKGLDYISCSPYRVPIARLAAAQAAIKEEAR